MAVKLQFDALYSLFRRRVAGFPLNLDHFDGVFYDFLPRKKNNFFLFPIKTYVPAR